MVLFWHVVFSILFVGKKYAIAGLIKPAGEDNKERTKSAAKRDAVGGGGKVQKNRGNMAHH
jgi:hypothetical protein